MVDYANSEMPGDLERSAWTPKTSPKLKTTKIHSLNVGPMLKSYAEYDENKEIGMNLNDVDRAPTEFHPGQKITLDKLCKLFPKQKNTSEIYEIEEREDYTIFGRIVRLETEEVFERLAYLCKKCKNLVLGPPEIADEVPGNIIRGYLVYCTLCKANIEDCTSRDEEIRDEPT